MTPTIRLPDRPHGAANFLVDLGAGDPRAAAAGFAEVVFPPFVIDAPPHLESGRSSTPGVAAGEASCLVLRRGATGNLDLYRWWDAARRAALPPMRTVTVTLLADDRDTVVMTWRFLEAYPVSLAYSPLRALDGGLLMETVALAFGRVEMATPSALAPGG